MRAFKQGLTSAGRPRSEVGAVEDQPPGTFEVEQEIPGVSRASCPRNGFDASPFRLVGEEP
jgi:hypothetical protein